LTEPTDTKTRWNTTGFSGPQKVLKVTVLGKDIGQRFVYNFVGGSMKESGILIDQLSSRFLKPYGGVDMGGLDDLKQRHILAPSEW
jgi:hypothetical protein